MFSRSVSALRVRPWSGTLNPIKRIPQRQRDRRVCRARIHTVTLYTVCVMPAHLCGEAFRDIFAELSTLRQYCGENSIAISCVIVRLSICVCLKRPEGGMRWGGGGPHPNDSIVWTGRKHKSNLFHWQRKERTSPSFLQLSFSPVPPPPHPHPTLPLSSCSSHFPPSLLHPTLHPCMLTHLPHQPHCDGFVLLLCSVWQGNPRLEWGRGPTPSERRGVAGWMPR